VNDDTSVNGDGSNGGASVNAVRGMAPSDDVSTGRAGAAPGGRAAVIVAASVALVVIAIAAFSFGRLSTLADPTPTDASAEAGFARDMQVHHLQGTELALIVRDATDDPEVRLLAYDIATTQSQQAGQMYGWLSAWDLSQSGSEPSMAWMSLPADAGSSHDGHPATHAPGAPMPGLASAAEIEELRALRGVDAERRFLELMIAHHQGSVEMADAALARASNDDVLRLAQSIVDSQTSEIALMQELLAERG
jgi:uncharacterized protein (DUF305 family)